MERPVYHFKGIVKDGAEATKDFVGPLDLILHLLKKNKIAIRDLPLAGILEQFLAWMETRRALDLAVAGEFIAMASHLMLLKTRMLLSQEDKEAQAEMAALIASLEARQRHASAQRVRAVLPRLEALWQRGSAGFPKPPENVFFQRVYRYEHKPSDLTRALNAWQARQKLALPPGRGAAGAVPGGGQGRPSPGPAGAAWAAAAGGDPPHQPEPVGGHGGVSGAAGAVPGRTGPSVGGLGGSGNFSRPHLNQKQNQRKEGCPVEQAERERAVEAILFALGEPVPTARLAQALDAEEDQVLAACQALAAFYETQDRGIRLVQLEESWQLVSAPRWGAVIRGLLARKKPDKLSASALETLALVAYFQPVTRVYLDQARGVDSAHSLGVLLDRELVEPCGTLDAPGRPTLYRTTQTFLRSFGLSDLADLPPLPEGIPAEAGGAP